MIHTEVEGRVVDGTLENFVRDNRPVHVDLGIGQVGGQEDHVEDQDREDHEEDREDREDHEEETGGIADQDILG